MLFHGKAWLNTGANDSVYLFFFLPIPDVVSKLLTLAKKKSFVLASSLLPTMYHQSSLKDNVPEIIVLAHYEMTFQSFHRLIGC